MESRLSQVVTKAQAAEKQFDKTLADSSLPLSSAITQLHEYRLATDEVLQRNFLQARSSDVETRLWAAHSRLNARLRKQLSKLRKDRPNKPVESRKLTKLYLEFLKDSQRFYREYIQNLNARFGGISELQRIARQLKHETANTSQQSPISPELHAQVLSSCHQTLIYLGDLFRYRAAEKLDKTPDWGPAMGYYALAASLRPCSGLAYHQESIVAFEQRDYLRSTYYLYRAIVVEEPHANAIANLELQFEKITAGWERGELVPKNLPHDKSASRKALVAWFVRFHSMCYKGNPFSQYEELEKEVLSRAKSELKNRSIDGVLPKMMFINFAAQATAAQQFQHAPDHQQYMQSYFFFLRLNVKFFYTLLESFAKDLEKHLENLNDRGSIVERNLSENISDQARHILPCLRLYSAWLRSNIEIVSARVGDETLIETVARFWTSYTTALSALGAAFPFLQLPEVGYQLEEDVDAFGFKPLESDGTKRLWQVPGNTELKPKFSDPELVRLDMDTEMLARVRELLLDAMYLAVDGAVPMTYDGSRFIVQESPSALVLPPQEDLAPAPEHITAPRAAPQHNFSPENATQPIQDTAMIQPQTHTREAQLKNMVDDLVGPEADEDEHLPPTPPAQVLSPAHGGFYGTSLRNGSFAKETSPRSIPKTRTPELRTATNSWHSSNSPLGRSSQRLQSVSSIWNDVVPQNVSPLTPNPSTGLPQSSLPSNATLHMAKGHSRMNSGLSIKSPLPNQDGWSSFEPTPQAIAAGNGRYDHRLPSLQGPDSNSHYGGMHSPLLFGAGGGPWSTGPRNSLSNTTPANGQGG